MRAGNSAKLFAFQRYNFVVSSPPRALYALRYIIIFFRVYNTRETNPERMAEICSLYTLGKVEELTTNYCIPICYHV